MKIGHSYLRWSSSEQTKGDSLRRQIEARDRICHHRAITLVESYTDPGVSAHRGKHRTKGNLARLLKDIGTTIKSGEYLLIENIDRLSRENPRKAWKHFNEIIDVGITIITTYNDREYSAKTIDDNPWQMHELLGEMQRAHSESVLKSERIGQSWERRRREAGTATKKISPIVPAWLEVVRNEQDHIIHFKNIPERVKVVQDIFELASNGMGQWTIAKTLNDRKVPTFGKGEKWRSGFVGKIVSSQAVLGTYVPNKLVNGRWEPRDPIEGYFGEAIVDPAAFARANMFRNSRDATEAARKRRGKTLANIFNGRCFCDECGGVMRYKTYTGKKKDGVPRKARKYLFCENNMLGSGCNYVRKANYDWIEETILNYANVFPLEELFNDHTDNAEIQAFEAKISSATLKLDKLERDAAKARRFMKDAETIEEEREWQRDLNVTLDEIKPVQAELYTLRRKKSDLEVALSSRSEARSTIERLKAELKGEDLGDRFVIRQRLSVLLKTFIDQVRFHEEFITVILHGGLINYRFSLSRPGGAPKKNPMKLIEPVIDLRPMIGDPRDGFIRQEAFTGGDPGKTEIFNRLLLRTQ